MKRLLMLMLIFFALVGCSSSEKKSNDFEGVYVLYTLNPDKEVEREERVFIQFNGGAYMSYKSKTGEPVLMDFKEEYKACNREEYNESDF
ncbi:MAG: hypothetical protein K2N34_06295, partial [Lachnospiraceae bacterium]|nr:hypothetical protein [Lachnospiraceae bacterium]